MRVLDGVIRWSIGHRVVVLIGAGAVACIGLWSATHAHLDALPDFTPPRVVVQTQARGLGTSDVEQLITTPLETALLGTPDAESVRSTSSPGLSVVVLTFADTIDIFRARQLVAERVAQARDRLPQSAEEPVLAPVSPPIGALLKFALTSTSGTDASLRGLRSFAEWQLRPRLLSVPGVSQVIVHGGAVERIEIRPDPARLVELGVELADITAAVQASQSALAGGFVEDVNSRLDVQSLTRAEPDNALAALAAVALPSRRTTPTRLDAVATVALGAEPRIGAARYDGRPAVYIQVNKVPGADTVTVTGAVERALQDLVTTLPAGARLEPPVFRQASFVHTSVVSVGRAMALGSLLVIAVLIAFLRSPRIAAISVTAIPLSILAAVAVLVWLGMSINGMTLGGLAIAVGEVVDDAIVDVENVWRRLRVNAASEDSRPLLEVIHDASLEIRGSVVYATFIVMLVLVPVIFIGGVAGRIFAPLAEAYILAIAASLVVALTVTPAMCALLLPGLVDRGGELTRLSQAMLARYRRVVRWAVRRQRLVFVVVAVLVLSALVLLPLIGGSFLPEFHEGALIGEIDAAAGSSLPEVERLVTALDGQTKPVPAVHTAARIGRAELDEDASPLSRIEMDFVLDPADHRDVEEIAGDLSQRIGRVAGINATVEGFLSERINEILSGQTAPVGVVVRGADLQSIQAASDQVTAAMRKTAGLASVRPDVGVQIPQLRIVPRPLDLGRYGLAMADFAEQVATWRQGATVTRISGSGGRTIDVVVAGPMAFQTRAALPDLPLRSAAGGRIRLADVADIEQTAELAAIRHDGGQRQVVIGADVRGKSVSGAVKELEGRLRSLALPPGIRVEVTGQSVARRSAAIRLLLVGAAVLVGILLLLVIALESFRDAAIVLLNFPLGLIGGVLAAALMPDGLSVAGFVGFVTLFGIVARNGIMLVSHRQVLATEAPDLEPEARTLRAAEERLLPIVMTAATAGLGLLPLALSILWAGSELESPMAIVVLGGLLTSTALNMVVLPTVYVYLDRRRERRATT